MARKKFLQVIALIIIVLWFIQILTGFLALGLLAYELDTQFIRIITITLDGNFVFYIRQLHMLISNIVTLTIIVHLLKAMTAFKIINMNKALFWIISALLFLFILITAFTGYVIVAGNMSFWAAIVILSLATIIPLLGILLIDALLGSAVLTDAGIKRFTVIHFLLALCSTMFMIMHIILIHKSNPSSTAHVLYDGNVSLNVLIIFDLYILSIGIILIFTWEIWGLIHPDNWKIADALITPAHIEPEVYFLWLFSIIKFHNSKIAGLLT